MNQNNTQITLIPEAPLFVCDIDDPQCDLKGWLVIHSVGSRGCCGGIRLYPDVTREESILLARAMTYKYCICGYTLGGAKGALKIPFDIDKNSREILLENFGRHIGPFIRNRIYQPWTDMNCSVDDIRSMYKGAGKTMRLALADSAYTTALSTFEAVTAVAEHLHIDPRQCRVTIEGFGGVGSNLAIEIMRWGGRVVGVSNRLGTAYNPQGLDVQALFQERLRSGDKWIEQRNALQRLSREQLFSLKADIHVPCARVQSLTGKIAEGLDCKAVVPAANEPLTADAVKILMERKILSMPYFVVNIGGLTGSGLINAGAADSVIRDVFSGSFRQMISRLLKLSGKTGLSPLEIAAHEAAGQYQKLFVQQNHIKPRKDVFSRLAAKITNSRRRLLEQKIRELTTTFNSRFIEDNC